MTGAACRDYTRQRGTDAGARRDLETLRAAINHHAREGFHRGNVRVTLPPRGAPRQRFLSRDEVARLIWAAWRAREVQTIHRGRDFGRRRETAKRPLAHIPRFILLAVYTGTRASAIAAGVDLWEAAGFLGMSVQILERVYGHHHPAHLQNAARAIGYRRNPAGQSLAMSLAEPNEAPPLVQVVEDGGGPGRTRTCNQIVMSDRL